MSDKKLLVVIGATGTQGGSVVDTFIGLPDWHIRGLTRDAAGIKAQALGSRGVEMVDADLDSPQSLVSAFRGAYAIFSNTDGWAMLNDPRFQQRASDVGKSPLEYTYDTELRQGKNVFDAASRINTLERLIFSSLSNASKWSRGKYKKVLHFDAKAHAADYGRDTHPELWKKTSIIQVGWYLSNWSSNPYMMPKKSQDGVVEFVIGVPKEQEFPFIAPESDTGPFVLALVNEAPGKNLITYRAWMSMKELINIVGRIKDVRTRCIELQMDVNSSNEFIAGYAENMGYISEFGFEGKNDETVMHPRELADEPALGTVSNWVEDADWSAVL